MDEYYIYSYKYMLVRVRVYYGYCLQNPTPAVGMERSLYVEGNVDSKAFHFIDEPESRVERDGVNARGLVGVQLAERRFEENASLGVGGVISNAYSRSGPTATPPLPASKFSQLTQTPHYSSQTVSSRARSLVAGAMSLADEQAVESAALPPPAGKGSINTRYVSQQPLLELQSSPRSSQTQTRSDEKLQYPKLAKAKDKARTLPHANAGGMPGRATRGVFSLLKLVNDGSKSARGAAGQVSDGRLMRPKTAFDSLPD